MERVASFQEGDQWVLELDLDPGSLRAAEVPQFDEMAKAFWSSTQCQEGARGDGWGHGPEISTLHQSMYCKASYSIWKHTLYTHMALWCFMNFGSHNAK